MPSSRTSDLTVVWVHEITASGSPLGPVSLSCACLSRHHFQLSFGYLGNRFSLQCKKLSAKAGLSMEQMPSVVLDKEERMEDSGAA